MQKLTLGRARPCGPVDALRIVLRHVPGARPLIAVVAFGAGQTRLLAGEPYGCSPSCFAAAASEISADRAIVVWLPGVDVGVERVVRGVTCALQRQVTVRDILVVRVGRWWSLACGDPGCCPPEGHPLPVDLTVDDGFDSRSPAVRFGKTPAQAR
jgi:hypothetical protein